MKPTESLHWTACEMVVPYSSAVAGSRHLSAVAASVRRKTGQRGAFERRNSACLFVARRAQHLLDGARWTSRTSFGRRAFPVTVANFMSWSSLADEAAAGYKSGRLKTIILVGHSSGATALPDMVAKLGTLGVPIKLAIGLDSVFRNQAVG